MLGFQYKVNIPVLIRTLNSIENGLMKLFIGIISSYRFIIIKALTFIIFL